MKKKKRGVGIKARIYFDEIDLRILEALNTDSQLCHEGAYPVLILANTININRKSLQPHLEKLINLGLVDLVECSFGKDKNLSIGLTTPKIHFDFLESINYYEDTSEQRYIKDEKEVEYFETILEVLQNVRRMLYKQEKEQLLKIDLRSKETLEKFGASMKK